MSWCDFDENGVFKKLEVKCKAKIENLKVKGNLDVKGNISGANLNISGLTSTQNLNVSGTENVGNLNVSGTAGLNSLNVTGNATVGGNLTVNGIYNNLGPSIQPINLVSNPDFKQNIIPTFSSSNDYYIIQRHAGRYAASITTFPSSSPGKFTANFTGLTANNEWRADTGGIIPPISPIPSGAPTTTPGVPNVWAPPMGPPPGTIGDTRPLTVGGAQQIIAFFQYLVANNLIPTSGYVNLHANLRRQTIQTASLFWQNVLGSPASPTVSVNNSWVAPQTLPITNVSNTTPIVITVTGTAFPTGTSVTINGTGIPAIDAHTFSITNTSSTGTGGTTFSLDGTTASGSSVTGTATANPPPPFEIISNSATTTGDKYYAGTTATGYGSVPPLSNTTINGVSAATAAQFRPEIYDNGHTINFTGGVTNFVTPSTAPVPDYEAQVMQILNRLLPVTGFNSGDLSGSLQQIVEWIIQQYIDQGPWINTGNLSVKEYVILNNFFFSNITSFGTANFAGHLVANLLVDLNAWVSKTGIYSSGGNAYFAGHDNTLQGLMTALQITHDYHNIQRAYPVSGMILFVRNKTSNNVTAYSVAPNPPGSSPLNPPDINFHTTLLGTTILNSNISGATAANPPA